MKLFALVLATIAACGSCGTCCGPEPMHPQPGPDAADAGAGATCEQACTHARDLGCKEGQPSKTGKTCEEVCTNAANFGILFNTSCMVETTTCELLSKCQG